MPSTFTPSTAFNANNEKDWAANLGMMDWDSTSIVFTKRSLIEFLKYTGTTVDTHFSNIQKMPRYARFGKIEGDSSDAAPGTNGAAPSGNKSIIDHDIDDDALAGAPPKTAGSSSNSDNASAPVASPAVQDDDEQGIAFSSAHIKPSRRVRELPGGTDNIASIFGGSDEPQDFKPTRRVRQGPGGQDNVGSLF